MKRRSANSFSSNRESLLKSITVSLLLIACGDPKKNEANSKLDHNAPILTNATASDHLQMLLESPYKARERGLNSHKKFKKKWDQKKAEVESKLESGEKKVDKKMIDLENKFDRKACNFVNEAALLELEFIAKRAKLSSLKYGFEASEYFQNKMDKIPKVTGEAKSEKSASQFSFQLTSQAANHSDLSEKKSLVFVSPKETKTFDHQNDAMPEIPASPKAFSEVDFDSNKRKIPESQLTEYKNSMVEYNPDFAEHQLQYQNIESGLDMLINEIDHEDNEFMSQAERADLMSVMIESQEKLEGLKVFFKESFTSEKLKKFQKEFGQTQLARAAEACKFAIKESQI